MRDENRGPWGADAFATGSPRPVIVKRNQGYAVRRGRSITSAAVV
ncbi:hypothetical protein UCMB321_2755 [Pseudomonas batumici]|uniref:Uncharacterized protein n=1 Tax=Pseudomonas batumici TaxID=226910 RepID=A0A0C2I2I6_9PSED|nr:hypothetical protein UCMB321_2755 [Pseudomonas batumici]